MNQGKYVFAQLATLLPKRQFDHIVNKHNGDKYVKHFSCWNQLLCMVFGQLTSRESLRDLIKVVSAHKDKTYHLGFGKNVSRDNLANANKKRDYRIFEEYASHMMALARSCISVKDDFHLNIEGNIYAVDASIVDLCIDVFWWAQFRKQKAGIKIHAFHDVKTDVPAYINITSAKEHDIIALDKVKLESGAIYVLDRAYLDFSRLFKIETADAYFVTRLKRNINFKRVYSNSESKQFTGIKSDQIIKLTSERNKNNYPKKLRRIHFYDEEKSQAFEFVTNNMKLEAWEITRLYKDRWSVELLFRWLKQHLKIKAFWGNTANAVRIQIYAAIIGYCLVAILKEKNKTDYTIYEILQVLSLSYFDKTPVSQLVKNIDIHDASSISFNQLNFSFK